MSEPSFKVGDRVRHRWAKRLQSGTVKSVTDRHPNPAHDVSGWWYTIDWDSGIKLPPGEWEEHFAERVLELL